MSAFDWPAMVQFLAPRAIPGVEVISLECYERTVTGEDGTPQILKWSCGVGLAASPGVGSRLRRLFDLDADSEIIDRHLSADPLLAPLIAARPGIRVPGAWDTFELAVRAILGQQVSVKGATTLAGRLAAAYGEPVAPNRVLFPRPEVLVTADLTAIGLTRARAAAISALAGNAHLLANATIDSLCNLPGIGPWTAQYIAMRALGDPDAFPHSDLGLLRATGKTPKELLALADAWRPYRAYAAMRLWLQA